MSIIQAIVYGVVQGIGEFLPISSTAHIVLVPWLLGWKDPGVVFDVALHLGTASAVILFFLKDWMRLISAGFSRPRSTDGKLFWFIVLATIPGGIAGVMLDKYMENFRNPALIGVMLIAMGIVLYLADKMGNNEIEIEYIGLSRSIVIGISQAFAIIPGVSRSGVTMSTGRMLGITRESIARFTFLMSAPIILADGLYHAKGIVGVPVDKIPFLVAVLTSAIVGALSIKFLLDYLKRKSFGVFAVYRFIVGALVIAVYFLR
ncbi:MAG TPA: undecaprenyl-diphosphate phosphatase [Syntrophomonadaceae bacterium]|nr:undecaprenyl-diphosphate phosphatase [Syntrophomonadaceae bacterium]